MTAVLMTAAQAAKRYGFSKSSLYRWAYEGHLPHVRFQGTLRFRVADLERIFLKENVVPATDSPRRS